MTRSQRWLFAGIMALALALRVWGIGFGLPFVYHPDEPNYVLIAQRMVKTGDWNPHFFNFPSALFYLNALAYGPYYAVGRLTGSLHGLRDIAEPHMLAMGTGYTEQPATFVMGRALTVLLGLGTVWLVFLSGRALTGSHGVALLAALLSALSPTQAVHSHLITPDVLQTFWVTVSFWGAVQVYRQGRVWHYALAGLAAGAAASTKYAGVLILAAVLLAHFLRHGVEGLTDWRIYLAFLLSGVAFVAITPYAWLDPQAFLDDLGYEAGHYATGHLGMEGHTVSWYLAYLWRIEGPVAVLAFLQAVRGAFKRSRETWLLTVFPLIYYLFINRYLVRNDRTLLPLLPFLSLLAACWLIEFWRSDVERRDRLAQFGVAAVLAVLAVVLPGAGAIRTDFILSHPDSAIFNGQAWLPAVGFLSALAVLLGGAALWPGKGRGSAWGQGAGGVLALLALLLPLAQTVKADIELTVVDSRETARLWIDQNLPGGSRVAIESYAPCVNPDRFWVEGTARLIEHSPQWYVDHYFEYLVASQRMFMRFYRDPEMYARQIAQYDELFEAFELVKAFADGGYEVRVYKTGVD